MLNKKIIITVIAGTLSLSSFVSSAAFAGGGIVGGSTEITQLLNNFQLIEQYSKQIQQYELQLQNLRSQANSVVTDPVSFVNKLATAVERGEALGLSSARITSKMEAAYGSNYNGNAPYNGKDYTVWMQTTKDSIRGAMQAVGAQQDDFNDDADTIRQLTDMAGSAQGNLQIQQVGSQIALSTMQQLQKLRSMNMAQAQAVNARMLAVQNKEENSADVMRRFFSSSGIPNTKEARQTLRQTGTYPN